MYKGKKVLAIIPARGGSKGLPNKNIILLAGEPLLSWTIKQAMQSELIDRIILSTDSDEIAAVARKCGLEVPFLRPPEFALDTSPSWEAVLHAISIHKNENYDYIVLLEPTSPLRKKTDIDEAIKKIIERKAVALISVGVVHTEHPAICKLVDENGYASPYIKEANKKFHQRQQLRNAYFPYGVIYISETDKYIENKTFYTDSTIVFEIERWQNYEIDDMYDLQCVESIIMNNPKYIE